MLRTHLTLCFIHDDERILLGMKKRGFGAGKWNGFGGKLEPDESAEDAARREVREEVGVDVSELVRAGTLEFVYPLEDRTLEVSVFRATGYSGEPIETDEMRPEWFRLDAIPYAEMWLDDPFWLPLFLEGKRVFGRFVFHDDDTLVEYEVTEQ